MKKPREPRETVKAYFPFYPDRWLTSRQLRVCSPAARGVLIDLMAMAWGDGGEVTESSDALAHALGLTVEAMTQILAELEHRGRIILRADADTVSVQVPQLVEVYAEAVAYIEARREDGVRGAQARYAAPPASEPAPAMPPEQGTHRVPIASLCTDRTVLDRTVPEVTGSEQKGVQGDKPPVPPAGEVAKEKKSKPRFQKPTIEEVRAHCTEKGYTFDPEAFFAYYESNGWRVGRGPMQSWQSACVTWQKRQSFGGSFGSPQYAPKRPTQAGAPQALEGNSTIDGIHKFVPGGEGW